MNILDILNESVAITDVYHGTKTKFDKFEQTKGRVSTIFGTEEVDRYGFFFTKDLDYARSFASDGGHIIVADLHLTNILDLCNGFLDADMVKLVEQGISERYMCNVYPEDMWQCFDGVNGEHLQHAIAAAGYDGVMLEESADERKYVKTYIVFDSNKIKIKKIIQ